MLAFVIEKSVRGERLVIHLYQYWVGAERLGLVPLLSSVAHAMHCLRNTMRLVNVIQAPHHDPWLIAEDNIMQWMRKHLFCCMFAFFRNILFNGMCVFAEKRWMKVKQMLECKRGFNNFITYFDIFIWKKKDKT